MIKAKTVLVVGAGASAELNLPTGEKLKELIRDRLDFDRPDSQEFRALLQIYAVSQNWPKQTLNLTKSIRNGLVYAKSIDNFIRTHDANQELVEICKLTIAYVITKCEQGSFLTQDGALKSIHNRHPVWLEVFAQNLFAELSVKQLHSTFSDLKIVCFNYDRCIEVYMQRAIADYFMVDSNYAQQLASQLEIIHPYGSLGSLWGEAEIVEFAASHITSKLEVSAKNIRTFHEGVSNPEIGNKIKSALLWAETIVFLGFGFLAQNMELIKSAPQPWPMSFVKMFATAHGFSPENLNIACQDLRTLINAENDGSRVSLRVPDTARKCADLLDAHRAELFGL